MAERWTYAIVFENKSEIFVEANHIIQLNDLQVNADGTIFTFDKKIVDIQPFEGG